MSNVPGASSRAFLTFDALASSTDDLVLGGESVGEPVMDVKGGLSISSGGQYIGFAGIDSHSAVPGDSDGGRDALDELVILSGDAGFRQGSM
ncbi:hypothetical protein [Mycolicibacterium fluoranthenivorans]|uniref:Uncharacterized protein n=1 Tax=Mycolicibacterium fluoranthenivorans TaxID=258505 RepID=A0A7X5TYE4_9MYCO|nr:hypothetical protein [Mycolicibacterium fluoranthenivorans]NIH95029.1 hypothetical protein [Mycolicibacterium fluoranthenivorans]